MARARAKLDSVHRSAERLAEAHEKDAADLAGRERALADARAELDARGAAQVRLRLTGRGISLPSNSATHPPSPPPSSG